MIVLPREVTGRVEALGEAGRRWLAHLEETVCYLEQEWGVSAGEVLSGGSHGLVCLCGGVKGGEYVLKIDVPENSDTVALWRCRFLHQQTAVPAGGIWDWGYLQTVSTGLVLMQIGQKQYGKAMLELAGEWAGHWDRVRE